MRGSAVVPSPISEELGRFTCRSDSFVLKVVVTMKKISRIARMSIRVTIGTDGLRRFLT